MYVQHAPNHDTDISVNIMHVHYIQNIVRVILKLELRKLSNNSENYT